MSCVMCIRRGDGLLWGMGGINESERETDRKKDRLTYRKGRGGSNESERQTDRQIYIYLHS